MAPKIHTPVKGFTGKVAGVTFVDGAGETTDEAALTYFERHGYTIEADVVGLTIGDVAPVEIIGSSEGEPVVLVGEPVEEKPGDPEPVVLVDVEEPAKAPTKRAGRSAAKPKE